MIAQAFLTAECSTPQVMAASNSFALSDEVNSEIIAALQHCGSKVLHRDADGNHRETHMVPGLYPSDIHGTRCFFNLEHVRPGLRDLLAPPQLWPSVVDRVNLYLSPPGTGAPMHFDIRPVVIVQLFGRKLWQVASKPAVRAPSVNTVVADEKAGEAWYGEERLQLPDYMNFILLEPGDWLLVPCGTWHSTFSEKGSISATLAFQDSDKLWQQIDRLTINTHKLPLGRRLPC